jgi:hypothetical protein
MSVRDIDAILSSWTSSGACTLSLGATIAQLHEAESNLCRTFPEEFFELYRRCNGADVLDGNIQLYPLDGGDLSVAHSSEFLRASGWPIPEELVIFAGNGGGDSFGLWLPENWTRDTVVVEVGAILTGGSFAIVGTSLARFLRGRTAYYLLLLECAGVALDKLEVPPNLRKRQSDALDEENYDAFLRWASPELPDYALSPYEARLTAEDLRSYARKAG